MKKKIIIIFSIILGVIILIVVAGIIKFNPSDSDIITIKEEKIVSPIDKLAEKIDESQAIKLIKDRYLELGDYPNNNFPIRSIKTEKSNDGWYVAFVTEGSGVPIINAKCFEVKNDKSIFEKKYTKTDNYNLSEFSVKECKIIQDYNDANKPEVKEVICTMDAKQCPDGSYVGRSGPNCEFVCPK